MRVTEPIAIAALLALTLAGCAGRAAPELSAGQCRAANWREVGRLDGLNGRPAVRLSAHEAACAPAGVRIDQVAYAAGRSEGLELYCTATNGYRLGRNGEDYLGVCPPDSAPDFLREYNRGQSDRPWYDLGGLPTIGLYGSVGGGPGYHSNGLGVAVGF